MSVTLIERIQIGSDQTSILLDNIPNTYTDLLISVSVRTNQAGSPWVFGELGINGQSQAFNQFGKNLAGRQNGSNPEPFSAAPRYYASTASATSNTYSNSQIYIAGYTGSASKAVSIDSVSEDNTPDGGFRLLHSGLWDSSEVITSIELFPRAGYGAWASRSSVTLYGITEGSSGTTVVS